MNCENEYQEFTAPENINDEKFSVKDLNTANWCIKKIGSAEKRINAASEFVKAEKEKLDAYLEKVKAEETRTIEFMTSMLRPFASDQLVGQKKKSIKLPNGTCGFKTSGPKIQRNDAVLLEFVKANAPEYIKVAESVDWAEYKKNITVTENGACVDKNGEIVPGLIGEESVEVFTVKFKETNMEDE